MRLERIDDPEYNWEDSFDGLAKLVPSTVHVVAGLLESDFPGYPASLFKNASKSDALATATLKLKAK